jgi:hypothetical protein
LTGFDIRAGSNQKAGRGPHSSTDNHQQQDYLGRATAVAANFLGDVSPRQCFFPELVLLAVSLEHPDHLVQRNRFAPALPLRFPVFDDKAVRLLGNLKEVLLPLLIIDENGVLLLLADTS